MWVQVSKCGLNQSQSDGRGSVLVVIDRSCWCRAFRPLRLSSPLPAAQLLYCITAYVGTKCASNVWRADACRWEKGTFVFLEPKFARKPRLAAEIWRAESLLAITRLLLLLPEQHAAAGPAQPEEPGLGAEDQQTQAEGLRERGPGLGEHPQRAHPAVLARPEAPAPGLQGQGERRGALCASPEVPEEKGLRLW